MPYPLKLIEPQVLRAANAMPLAGHFWFAPWLLTREDFRLSLEYDEDWRGHRPPIIVRLPGAVDWVIDGLQKGPDGRRGHGWRITGDVPILTASPEIEVRGVYRGFLKDGVLSDDLDGRRFYREEHGR